MEKDENMIVRKARAPDSGKISLLLGELGYPRSGKFILNKIKRLGRKKEDKIFVAVIGLQVVGFASCHIVPLMHQSGNLCRVTSIVVSERYRQRGVGRRLMEASENYARARGCIKVEVTSGDHRADAHQFYKKLGYEEVSRRFLKNFRKT